MKIVLLLATLCAPDADSLATLAGDIATAAREASAPTVLETERLDAKEPSGIAVLPNGTLLVVDDEKGLYRVRPGRDDVRLDVPHGSRLDGPEGIAVSADGRTAWVVSEDDRQVHAISLDGLTAGAPRKIGTLPVIGAHDYANKGWEGIAFLPAALGPEGKDRLVAIHEGKPRRIGFFDPADLGDPVLIDLPEELDDQLADLSDLAVDPRTGNLVLLSDVSVSIAEISLAKCRRDGGIEARAVSVRSLPFARGLHPEGLSFAKDGTLWIVTEGDRSARRISLE